MSRFLQVNRITRRFAGADQAALADVSFDLNQREFVTLVGASGSGKTTLLRLLAGLETPDAGEINLEGEMLSRGKQVVVPPEQRNFGFVFQNHALFPHLSVSANVGFGLAKQEDKRQRINELLELVGLEDMENRFPHELSGGEQQRIALVRALAPKPRLLMMDEPFSSLDKALRHELRGETRRLIEQQGITTIMVTHDTDDALAVSDRIVVLKDGGVEQIGAPADIYRTPANRYVASAFGACSFLERDALGARQEQPLIRGVEPSSVAQKELWLRPEDLRLKAPGTDEAIAAGAVSEVFYHGSSQLITLECSGRSGKSFTLKAIRSGDKNVPETGTRFDVVIRPGQAIFKM